MFLTKSSKHTFFLLSVFSVILLVASNEECKVFDQRIGEGCLVSEQEARFSMESSALRAGLVGNCPALLSQLQQSLQPKLGASSNLRAVAVLCLQSPLGRKAPFPSLLGLSSKAGMPRARGWQAKPSCPACLTGKQPFQR